MLAAGSLIHRRYRVAAAVGRGGLGTTYRVRDELFQRDLALKVVTVPTEARLGLLRAEFERLRALAHPCLACVHDFGRVGTGARQPTAYYTSDWIDGIDLAAYAAGRSFDELLGPVRDALSALALLHRAGIRHGDFKPANVLVRPSGAGVLIDLSASAPLGEPQDAVSGTPGFIAPEVARSGGGDARADLFAVGVTLRSLLPHGDAALRALCERLCALEPARRPADVAEVLGALGVEHPEIAIATPRPVPLMERDAALDTIRAAVDALVARRPGDRALAVVGEDGAGKTRLLREAKWLAQQQCEVIEGDSAAPLHELFERAAGGSLPRGPSAPFDALEALRRAGDRVVLVMDDAHRLDPVARGEWYALARQLEPSDPLALIWAAAPGFDPPAVVLELANLSPAAVASWARGLVPRTRMAALMKSTEGRPGRVAWVLEELAAGHIGETDLATATPRRAPELADLSASARRLIALLACADEPVEHEDSAALAELANARLAIRHETGWWVDRDERPAIVAALDGELVRGAHRWHAERAQDAARAVLHLALGGELERALATARRHLSSVAERPDAWGRAAEALAGEVAEPEQKAWVAELLLSCGRPDAALAVLPAAVESLRRRADVLATAGEAFLERGANARASRWLRFAEAAAKRTGTQRARVAALRARLLIRQGAHAEALRVARAALERERDPALLEQIGIAQSYLGLYDEARASLDEAARLHAAANPRAQLRVLSQRAFVEFRSGNAAAAVDAYADALALAERYDIRDRIVNLAASIGAARHQLGRWAQALESYGRGLRAALVLGDRSQEIMLSFNIAKLHADIGLFDRARRESERVAALAEQTSLSFFSAASVAVQGEILAAQGRHDDAAECFARAAELFAAEGAKREEIEVRLQWAEARLAAGHEAEAERAFEALSGAALGAGDVEARLCLARGRLAVRRRAPSARELFERARRLASDAGQAALRAEIDVALAEVWSAQGALQIAAEARAGARAHWERVAADLPDAYREAFWAHPLRRALEAPVAREVTGPALLDKLRRLIDINKKLTSSLRVDEVLRVAIDSAIELTGAERGFVILKDKDEFSVSIARNIDREQIGKRNLKFSQSIASRVIATGDPVVTVDAGRDARFSSQRSVHLMRLKSIACVPIRHGEQTIGAMYLDNRFRPGAFQESALELLLAFADQVAIALWNARLHAELEQKTQELMAERLRVEALMKNQAAEIDRLAVEVREKQSALEHRYDYESIVGRGPRMQAVLAALDRVIDTSITVLIQGESGTGKELIARAIHFNGPRKDRPFVSINCGAVSTTLLESELFGHVRGAFTGADRDREGLFVAARGGTLFLDEIGDMPAEMQVKLLRVLQEREMRPVGATTVVPVDVRVVCATHCNLREEVARGRFREDLFYRISVVDVTVPALRERLEDIPLLSAHLLERICREQKRKPVALRPATMRRLVSHDWPGNVRELENVLTNALLMSTTNVIGPDALSLPSSRPAPGASAARATSRAQYRDQERRRIAEALDKYRWNVSEVARALGIPRGTLYRKLQRYGLVARP